MPRNHFGSNIERSEHYGALQRIVDVLFEDAEEAMAGLREEVLAAGDSNACGESAEVAASEARFAAIFGVSRGVLLGDGDSSAVSPSDVDAQGEEDAAVTVRRLDVVIQAEAADLPDDLMRIVNLIPPGDYTRQRLCDQLNSAITGHAWGQVYGTVE